MFVSAFSLLVLIIFFLLFQVVYQDGDAEELLLEEIQSMLCDPNEIPLPIRSACIQERKALSDDFMMSSTESSSFETSSEHSDDDRHPRKRQRIERGTDESTATSALTEENLKKLSAFEKVFFLRAVLLPVTTFLFSYCSL